MKIWVKSCKSWRREGGCICVHPPSPPTKTFYYQSSWLKPTCSLIASLNLLQKTTQDFEPTFPFCTLELIKTRTARDMGPHQNVNIVELNCCPKSIACLLCVSVVSIRTAGALIMASAESGKGKERPQNEQRGLNVKGPPKGQKMAFWAKICLLGPKVEWWSNNQVATW